MTSLSGINAATPLINIDTNGVTNPTETLLAAESGLSTSGLLGNTSTIVELTGESQLLSAATAFQDQLQALQPGTAGSGGGRNFGTDLASLAAEVQSFVDAFNGLQTTLAGISGTGTLFGESIPGASDLSLSLNSQVQASFSNGSSALTNLSQLGIELQPSPLPGGKSSLSINLAALQSAFNTDATGAFSLLAAAANSFSNLAGSVISQAGGQLSTLATLAQTSAGLGLFNNSSLFPNQPGNDLGSLLAISSLTGGANLQQVVAAINEYTLVSSLLG